MIQETAEKQDILSANIVSGEVHVDTFELESEVNEMTHVGVGGLEAVDSCQGPATCKTEDESDGF